MALDTISKLPEEETDAESFKMLAGKELKEKPENFNLLKKKEWEKSISDKEYFIKIKDEIKISPEDLEHILDFHEHGSHYKKRVNEDQKSYLMRNFYKFLDDISIKGKIRFYLRFNQSKEGGKFLNSFIEDKNTTKQKKEEINEKTISLIFEKVFESKDPSSVNHLIDFIKNANFQTKEKNVIIKNLLTRFPSIYSFLEINVPNWNKDGYDKGIINNKQRYINERTLFYKKLFDNFPNEINSLGKEFLTIEENFNLYNLNILIFELNLKNESFVQNILLHKDNIIKSTIKKFHEETVNIPDNTFDKQKYIENTKFWLNNTVSAIKRYIDQLPDGKNKDKFHKEFREITDPIAEESDKIFLEKDKEFRDGIFNINKRYYTGKLTWVEEDDTLLISNIKDKILDFRKLLNSYDSKAYSLERIETNSVQEKNIDEIFKRNPEQFLEEFKDRIRKEIEQKYNYEQFKDIYLSDNPENAIDNISKEFSAENWHDIRFIIRYFVSSDLTSNRYDRFDSFFKLTNASAELQDSLVNDRYVEHMDRKDHFGISEAYLKEDSRIEHLYKILNNENLIDLFAADSPLSLYKSKVFTEIIDAKDPLVKIEEFKNIFMNGLSSFYQKCIKVVETNLGAMLQREDYSTADLTHLWLLLYGPEKKPEKINFNTLTFEKKMQVLEDILKRSEMLSQSLYSKHLAGERNVKWINSFYDDETANKEKKINILNSKGISVHGSDHNFLTSILLNGNIAGECILTKSKLDAVPFHVDCAEINEKILTQQLDQDKTIETLGSRYYGDGMYLVYKSAKNEAKDINSEVYVYDLTSWPEYEKRVDINRDIGGKHIGILGAIPSTEISAIIIGKTMENDQNYVNSINNSIAENGFYIPVLNQEGYLIYSIADFDNSVKEIRYFDNAEEAVNDSNFYEKVLNEKINEKFPELFKSLDTMEGQGGVHKYSKKEHMQRATEYVGEIDKKHGYNLENKYLSIVKLAAKLHDIAKLPGAVQLMDNTSVAAEIIRKTIENIPESKIKIALLMIREDELLGKLLSETSIDENNNLMSTNVKIKEKFLDYFKSNDPDYSEDENQKLTEIYRKMMICMYKSDIMAIDDGEIYKKDKWAIDEKLKALGLDYA